MSNNFDVFYKSVLKETMYTTTQETASASNPNQQQPQQQQQNAQQPQQQNAQQPQQQNSQQPQQQQPQNSQSGGDAQLMNLLQQKLKDQQFKQQLMQMLNGPSKS